jgi:hypothetical protein
VKQLKWTKADAKRAEMMGWCLWVDRYVQGGSITTRTIAEVNRIRITQDSMFKATSPFKSDNEAIEWVMKEYANPSSTDENDKTIAKAIALCCGMK